MAKLEDLIRDVLENLPFPGDGGLVSNDVLRALRAEDGKVSMVFEAPSAKIAELMEPLRRGAEAAVLSLEGVSSVSIVMTAHQGEAEQPAAAPQLRLGRHMQTQRGPMRPSGVKRLIAIGSGKGGVGKSTVSSNLAVALARQGRKVGLLDADIYGPSQPRMMGVQGQLSLGDNQNINPVQAHGVTVMSIGMMVEEDEAVIWRGPMLKGAMQQMLTQVNWGELDVLLVDLPPGTGDVQLTLCGKSDLDGAIVVSTPQDVALIDARKALTMFEKLRTPVLGMIENMSHFCCPDCGGEYHIFGHGGVADAAEELDLPLLAMLPIDLETRLAGDQGRPVALEDGAMGRAYMQMAQKLIKDGVL
ncbi:P-loop NTPase [Epibacterium sp. SM1969]|uniref:Iron-sulfur cluster carrier protein n=1 Tax=Tritonibacter aquimaris TaxID=2663379 RepID=A0A844ASX0_9RHOB|nr:P-loop NTPase [Tritonibacter aquimaris]